jgi:hypothetical protein
MTLRLGALHDALLDPGNPEKALRAAEELAGYENRLANIKTRLILLMWMVATTVTLQIMTLAGLIWPALEGLPWMNIHR